MSAKEERVIRLGTRKSRLAMAQTELVAEVIRRAEPGIRVEMVPIVTTGDRILDRALLGVGGKGAFVTEFELAILEGRIDAAVHSAKDMPAELMEGLAIAAVLPREDSRDVLVTVKGSGEGRTAGAPLIGTGSLRRQVQIAERIPGAVCKLLRGNVNTRLQKLADGEYDGIILAAAGLKRLGLLPDRCFLESRFESGKDSSACSAEADSAAGGFLFQLLPEEEFIPAGGQGIIAVEGRRDSEFSELFHTINDRETETCLRAEREVLRLLGTGCNEAVGVYSCFQDGGLRLRLMKQTEEGIVRREVFGDAGSFLELAERLTEGMTADPDGTGRGSDGITPERSTAPADVTVLVDATAPADIMAPVGTVCLIGAGPGDPELLTLKGRKRLSEAEVLVYDRLASPEFLNMVPDGCEKIYVGKEPGRHSKKQEEINEILVEQAKKGRFVVRLKGGDSFVFGRGGEELLELAKHGIPYEVVPGVTSAVAALESAGIPVTHRGIAQSFHVITGHTAAGTSGEDRLTEGFSEYAKLPGTLVFLMGLSNLEKITERLITDGKSPKTPAAVVTDGTLPGERCVRASLGELAAAVRKAGLTSPGIIAVGEAAAFHMKCEKRLPLTGVTVGVTGTEDFSGKLIHRLALQGADVFRAGISRVEPCEKAGLLSAVEGIERFSWVVFTSRNGVKLFFEAMKEQRKDYRALSGVKFAVVGSGTEEFLERFGILADYKPEEYTTEALAEGLIGRAAPGERVLIPRAKQGSRILTEKLTEAGVDFLDLPVYDLRVQDGTELKARCRGAVDYITFGSGSGVRGFFRENGDAKREIFERGACPVCIGRVTADVLREYGVTRMLVSEDFTADGILRVILEDREHGSIRI